MKKVCDELGGRGEKHIAGNRFRPDVRVYGGGSP